MALRRVLGLAKTFYLETLDEKEIGRQWVCPKEESSPITHTAVFSSKSVRVRHRPWVHTESDERD